MMHNLLSSERPKSFGNMDGKTFQQTYEAFFGDVDEIKA